MTPVSRDPLTPEERELASRLSRIGPHGEPPAALDARILSAAHAALSATPRRHRRWPALLGVAATLALAVGISWQMRPGHDAAPVLEEGPVAAKVARPAAAPSAEMADAAAAISPPHSEAGAADKPRARTAPPAPARSKQPAREAPPIAMPSVEVPVDEEPMDLAPTMAPAPAPAPAPAAPPPPPPAPASAPVSTTASMPAPAADRAAASGAPKALQRRASPPPVAAETREMESATRIDDRALRDVPIEEDARLSATEWLDRIRLRTASDDLTGARASLALFQRYFPDRAIPQDLAPLAQ